MTTARPFGKVKRLHFVGIGGSGMSGIAEILLNMGYRITGSDLVETDLTRRLRSLGATVHIGHSPDNVGDNVDVVIVSSAVKDTNIEVICAKQKGIPIIPRSEMLAELMRMRYGIAIAGTHGKSTTTSIVGEILVEGGLDPTIVVGGRVVNLRSGAKLGMSDYFVAEADEFDRSFLKLSPTIAVITTLEAEHLECYGSFDELKAAFVEFANKVPFYGSVILCLDERSIQEIIPQIEKNIITYGLSTQADIRATRLFFSENGSRFDIELRGKRIPGFESRLLGLHNVKNILAAVGVGVELDVPIDDIRNAVRRFAGVYRRFQLKGEIGGVLVVDDFAHHPTEIRATLQAAKLGYNRRVIAVFQPHLYSRTQMFYNEFGKSFFQSDVLIVTNVYAAREEPIEDVTGELIADAARRFGHREVYYIEDRDRIPSFVLNLARPGDMIITLGAGDVWKICNKIVDELKRKCRN